MIRSCINRWKQSLPTLAAASLVFGGGTAAAGEPGKEPCAPGWVEGPFGWVPPSFSPPPGSCGNFYLGIVKCLAVFDDGAGPSLYAARALTITGSSTSSVMRFDIDRWTPLDQSPEFGGGSLTGQVQDLIVFDDGSGPALYACGLWFETIGDEETRNIARWDGHRWSAVGTPPWTNAWVLSMEVFDDGNGPALYVASGSSDLGSPVIARWDGQTWTTIWDASVMPLGPSSISVLRSFDDGSGPALYAGFFGIVSAEGASSIIRWDGQNWEPLDPAFKRQVYALEPFNDGNNTALMIGSQPFLLEGASEISPVFKWDGASIKPVPLGITPNIASAFALASIDEEEGQSLYIGLSTLGRVIRWDGKQAHTLGTSLAVIVAPPSPGGSPRSFVRFDDGTGAGPRLIAGGCFQRADGAIASGIAAWNGKNWGSIANHGLEGLNKPYDIYSSFASSQLRAVRRFDDGMSNDLYFAGRFELINGVSATSIVRWDGASFTPLSGPEGEGLQWLNPNGDLFPADVQDLAVFDHNTDGTPSLIVAGGIDLAGGVTASRVAAWDGNEWEPVGTWLSSEFQTMHSLAVFDDGAGPALYLAGQGLLPNEPSPVIRWDPETEMWVGTGTFAGDDGFALEVLDDGTGESLYAGGRTGVYRLAPTGWQQIGNSLPGVVDALIAYDDGQGVALYAAARNNQLSCNSGARVYRYDGDTWINIGNFNNCIYTLHVFNDGTGPALYAGGFMSLVDGTFIRNIARWDGEQWSPLTDGNSVGVSNPGFNSWVNLITTVDWDGSEAMLVGGQFRLAGETNAASIALWQGCPVITQPCPGDLTGSGTVDADDLGILLGTFGTTVEPGTGADLNGDGIINADDLGILLGFFGQPC